MIETPELYQRFEAMSEEERIAKLDPICEVFCGKATVYGGDCGVEVRANRIFALAALELYQAWQQEIFEERASK